MTARRLTITTDPEALRPGLAVLTELRRVGRDDLDAAICALSDLIEHGRKAAAKPPRDRRSVLVHLLRDAEHMSPKSREKVTAWCGRWGNPDEFSHLDRVAEVTTATCNTIEATRTLDLATCTRCLALHAKAAAR